MSEAGAIPLSLQHQALPHELADLGSVLPDCPSPPEGPTYINTSASSGQPTASDGTATVSADLAHHGTLSPAPGLAPSISTTPTPHKTALAEGPSPASEPTFCDPSNIAPALTALIEHYPLESDLTPQMDSGGGDGSGGTGSRPWLKPKPKTSKEEVEALEGSLQSDTDDSDVQYLGTKSVVVEDRKIIIDLTADSTDDDKVEKESFKLLVLDNASPRIWSNISTAFFMENCSDKNLLFPSTHFRDDIDFMDKLHDACHRFQGDITNKSHVWRIPYKTFQSMTAREIGDIFRHQSILVTDVDAAKQSFKDALRSLGSMRMEIVVTDQSVPDLDDETHSQGMSTEDEYEGKKFCQSTTRHRRGTLRQVLDSLTAKNPKSLNCLDIMVTTDDIQFQHLFSEKVTWNQTERKGGKNYPLGDMWWLLVSSGWTQHQWHQDCNSFATVITVLSGLKWWYIGTPKQDLPPSKQSGGVS
ncbi:hypothetical protein DXG01_014938 [Tephrocybe rancida]|nr:hypothetical protein DXG01_014938 [Tephrocybe rancida]